VTDPECDPTEELLAEWQADFVDVPSDMALTLGIFPLAATADTVTFRMPLAPQIAQPAGRFSAASLIGLADIAGTYCARRVVDRTMFPFCVALNTNILANTDIGTATSTSRVLSHRGRQAFVLTTVVADDGAMLLTATATYVAGVMVRRSSP
jgi:acyl-coenzyme A thioesterase PaaI-like protein